MFWLRLCVAICCFTCLFARRIPSYDYYEYSFYNDRDSWKEALAQRGSRLGHPREERCWSPKVTLGQVAGVSVDPEGRPVIFHRGGRTWDYLTFNETHHYQGGRPLEEDPVLVLDPDTGAVVRSWGYGRFLLPHGITVDAKGNTWLTDVALHQVFKFAPEGEEPELTIGEARIPGSDDQHLCKPTAVAVAPSSDFFVADGYCNSRILRFTADGTLVSQFGHQGSDGSPEALFVPHGLALSSLRDLLCVADRENHRVVCIRAGLKDESTFGEPVLTLQDPNRGRVFDVAFISGDGKLVGVCGSEEEEVATGFTADLNTGDLVDTWAPIMGFHNPHAIAVNKHGSVIYVAEIGPNRVWKFVVENPAVF